MSASMGIYLFRTDVILDLLEKTDYADFGGDIIPRVVDKLKICAYPYRRMNRIRDYILQADPDGVRRRHLMEATRDSQYWRDVGTLDAYWNANMDLTGVDPFFNLYGRLWPVRNSSTPVSSCQVRFQPARIRRSQVRDSGGFTGFAGLHNKRRDRQDFGAFLRRYGPQLGAG